MDVNLTIPNQDSNPPFGKCFNNDNSDNYGSFKIERIKTSSESKIVGEIVKKIINKENEIVDKINIEGFEEHQNSELNFLASPIILDDSQLKAILGDPKLFPQKDLSFYQQSNVETSENSDLFFDENIDAENGFDILDNKKIQVLSKETQGEIVEIQAVQVEAQGEQVEIQAAQVETQGETREVQGETREVQGGQVEELGSNEERQNIAVGVQNAFLNLIAEGGFGYDGDKISLTIEIQENVALEVVKDSKEKLTEEKRIEIGERVSEKLLYSAFKKKTIFEIGSNGQRNSISEDNLKKLINKSKFFLLIEFAKLGLLSSKKLNEEEKKPEKDQVLERKIDNEPYRSTKIHNKENVEHIIDLKNKEIILENVVKKDIKAAEEKKELEKKERSLETKRIDLMREILMRGILKDEIKQAAMKSEIVKSEYLLK